MVTFTKYEIKGFTRAYSDRKDKAGGDKTAKQAEGSEKDVGLSGATRKWLVYANGETPEERASVAANPPAPTALGLPEVGTAHPLDANVKLKSYRVSDNGNGSATYEATYEYKEEKEGGKEVETDSRAGWAPVEYPAVAQFDLGTESALVLPTGRPFKRLPSFVSVGLSYTAVKTYDSLPSSLLEANGCINIAPVSVEGYSVLAHCGLLKIHAEPIVKEGNTKWKVLVTIEIRRTPMILSPGTEVVDIGHDVAILLSGTAYRPSANEPPVAAALLDADGRSETVKEEEVLLTDTGEQVPSSGSSSPVGSAYYKRVTVFPTCAFSSSWFS